MWFTHTHTHTHSHTNTQRVSDISHSLLSVWNGHYWIGTRQKSQMTRINCSHLIENWTALPQPTHESHHHKCVMVCKIHRARHSWRCITRHKNTDWLSNKVSSMATQKLALWTEQQYRTEHGRGHLTTDICWLLKCTVWGTRFSGRRTDRALIQEPLLPPNSDTMTTNMFLWLLLGHQQYKVICGSKTSPDKIKHVWSNLAHADWAGAESDKCPSVTHTYGEKLV